MEYYLAAKAHYGNCAWHRLAAWKKGSIIGLLCTLSKPIKFHSNCVQSTKVRFSTIGCTETKCWWTIQTAFFFLSKAKVLAKFSAFSISSTFIRQVFSAWASIFEIVSVTENLLSQTGRVISDVSVPCFAGGQRNDFKESTEYLSEYNLYY